MSGFAESQAIPPSKEARPCGRPVNTPGNARMFVVTRLLNLDDSVQILSTLIVFIRSKNADDEKYAHLP
jgi:hypothetical protein